MQHIKSKSDWLSYEFKPYFFFILAITSLAFKKNLALSTGQNIIAYVCVALLLVAGVRILALRAEYRDKASRK